MSFLNKKQLFRFDYVTIISIVFLLTSGMLAIFSLSFEGTSEAGGNFQKQIIFLIIATASFIFFALINYQIWKNYSRIFYVLGIMLLILVLFFGREIRGTSGWFSVGFFNIQPVELVKLFVILTLAKYLSRSDNSIIETKQIATSFVYAAIPAGLVLLQPDLGSASVIMAIWLGMLFFSGVNYKHLGGTILVLILGLALGWSFALKDYQKQRIESFMDPAADPLGSGYNVLQSIVAIGSGGTTGKGLGHGSQSQLNFLPEKHTDFIYAAIAEESGLVGSALVLAFIWVILFRLKKTTDIAKDGFGRLIVAGVMTVIFFQTIVNVGMNLGVMPVTGISLPFLSYGGSFLVITMALAGLSQSVWCNSQQKYF